MALTVLTIADSVSRTLYDNFQPERWRKVDLVLSAGDLHPEYLDFLCTNLNIPVLFVRGNHDGRYPTSSYDGSINVHRRIVECRGIRIAGFEGSQRYNQGTCQYTEAQMRRMTRWARLHSLRHGAPDIVLTHAPPAGIHDGTDLCHRGFQCFHSVIETWKPALFVHGHMHNYLGGPAETQIGSTRVVNAWPYRILELPEAPATVANSTTAPASRPVARPATRPHTTG